MTKQQRVAIARQILERAWQFRSQGDGGVAATWFIHGHDRLQIVATPFDERVPDVKRMMAEAVAMQVREAQPVEFVLFVSDAWTRVLPVGTTAQEAKRATPPSQSADAVECLFVQCWGTHPGQDFTLARRYRQRDDGTLERLEADDLMESAMDAMTFAAVVEAIRG